MTPTATTALAMVGALGGAACGGRLRVAIFCHSVREGGIRQSCPSCATTLVPDRHAQRPGGALGNRWGPLRAHPLRTTRAAAWGRGLPVSGRCPLCRERLGAPSWSVELSTAAVCGALPLRIDSLPLLVTLWWLTAVSVALAAVDVAVQRLPDALTRRAGAGLAAGLALTCVVEQRPAALLRAALAGLVLFAGYCGLALLSPTSLGFGDCKLAAVLGVVTGFLGWPVLVTATAFAFVLAAGYGLLLVALRRTRRRDPIAFGPFMLVGSLVAILCAS